MKILFEEEQRFNQWWLWLIMIIVAATCIIPLFSAPIDELPLEVIIISVVIPILVLGLITIMRLRTRIYADRVEMQYFPFVNRTIYWKSTEKARVIDYGFVGGWGIRIWTGYGTVYNVRGSKGLHLKMSDKEKVIGTQKPEELKKVIESIKQDGGYNW